MMCNCGPVPNPRRKRKATKRKAAKKRKRVNMATPTYCTIARSKLPSAAFTLHKLKKGKKLTSRDQDFLGYVANLIEDTIIGCIKPKKSASANAMPAACSAARKSATVAKLKQVSRKKAPLTAMEQNLLRVAALLLSRCSRGGAPSCTPPNKCQTCKPSRKGGSTCKWPKKCQTCPPRGGGGPRKPPNRPPQGGGGPRKPPNRPPQGGGGPRKPPNRPPQGGARAIRARRRGKRGSFPVFYER